MRMGVVGLAVVAVMGIAACGGDNAAVTSTAGDNPALLTLEQRIPGEAEAPGSEPDPRETRRTATGLEEVAPILEHQLITATEEEEAALEEAGFVSAILDTRFFPSEPGAEHEGGEPHIATLVMEFGSEAGAADAVALLHADGLEPCPETCAFDLAEFEPNGIPNAMGAQRIATQDSLDATGDSDLHPHAEYTIYFADGPFAYAVKLFGSPGEVSVQQAEEIAIKLHDRVAGAPPPGG